MKFQTARRLALKAVEKDWPELGSGTPYALPYGSEDADMFAVVVTAREYAVDGNKSWMLGDPPMCLVDKETGHVVITSYMEVADQVDAMREVSAR